MPLAIDILENIGQGSGGMDLDSDFLRVSRGDYVRGLNIRRVSNAGQTSYAYENILGNELAWFMPTVVRQNKIFKIYLTTVATNTQFGLRISDSNGLITTVTANIPANDIVNTLSSVLNNTSSQLSAVGQTYLISSTQTSLTTGFVTLEITTILGKDWFVTPNVNNPAGSDVVILQEAVDTSIAGDMKIIGGEELVGDLFIYSTTKGDLPSQLDINFVSGSAGNPYIIETVLPHGLAGGEEITINGLTIATNANGTWMVLQVLSPTQFTISRNWTANDGAGGTLTINTHGIGEIGVAVYDDNTGLSTYTTLIRSRKFNFVSPKQIDCYHEKNNILFSLYWTDDYNVPRVLYYKGAFLNNGAITEFNPLGRYRYDTLEEETRLFLKNTDVQLVFSQQYQTGGGGGVLSGNHRYAIRLVTESNATTEPTILTNPINTYTADFGGNPRILTGNAPVISTIKINELLITGIPPGVFKFVELIDINYQGAGFVASLVRRDLLTQASTQIIQHNGTEILEPFDAGELLFENTAYLTAKNIDGIENTLILSNLTTLFEADFSAWARTIKYRIKTKPLSSTGHVSAITAGEYMDFNNVNHNMGYMDNETYRIGVEVRDKATGVWSTAFFVDDITIDRAAFSSSGQRISGLSAWNLTTNNVNDPQPLPRYIEATQINYDFILSDGRRVRDVIDGIRFMRAECIPEVLATGLLHLGVKLTTAAGNFPERIVPYPIQAPPLSASYPNFVIRTTYFGGQHLVNNEPARGRFGFFYSPDILIGGAGMSFTPGMKLNILGQMDFENGSADYLSPTAPANYCKSTFVGYNGYLGFFNFSINYNQVDIDALTTLAKALPPSFDSNVPMAGESVSTFTTAITATVGIGVFDWVSQTCIALHTTADITQQFVAGFPPRGIVYVQIFRAIANKYGDPRNTKYVGTGHFSEVNESSALSDTQDIFGGDTFIQKTYIHQRIWGPPGFDQNNGFGGGYSFYSQNRINSQMRGGTTGVFPISQAFTSYPNDVATWLDGVTPGDETFLYDHGYDIRNQIQIDPAFDITAEQQTDLPTRFIYSDVKAQNSLVDNYRTFPPFNFKDADNNYGEVMHHANVNGNLMAWQIDAFSDMMFNPRAILSTTEGSEVITGTGAKLSQPQNVLSTYGTLNKWSVKLWLSAGGKDIAGWVTNAKSIARYGYDGTVIISDREHIKSFLANNLTWAQLYDTPAHGEGIHAVYDARFHDVIWVMRGRKNVQTWSSAFGYIVGAEVFVAGGTAFEQTGDIFISLINNNQNNFPPTSPNAWQKVSHSDGKYWNEYALVWNELTNKFQSFYSFKPKIMLEWINNFVSPSPRTEKNIYLHNRLKYCSWYQDGVAVQEEDGYIDMLLNKDAERVKHFLASMFNTKITPFRVECTTEQHKTFMVAADFERELDVFFAAIKNDILTSSNGQANNEDTGNIFGNYVIVRLYFEKLVYQKVVSAVIKYITTYRDYQT